MLSLLRGGSHCSGEFSAPDEQEGDGDGRQSSQPADPERPLESAGERGRHGVAPAQEITGVSRCYGRGDRHPDRPADLLGGVEQSRGDAGIMTGDAGQGSDRDR